VNLTTATAELLDGARDQRERLVSTAGEGVCGAEGRGDDRRRDDELPRSAEVEAPLEDRGRAWEIPATEVDETEIEQPAVERPRMIGLSAIRTAASACSMASSNRPSWESTSAR
jgi:hypothetical protein